MRQPSPGVALDPPIPPAPPGTGPIKIGVLLPLSGTFVTPQYLDVVNAMTKVPGNDTIDGRPVQIIAKDDQGNATTGAAATRELLDSDKVA
jgi:ABC-type branched-subunit amino acid transport system substrate-binding protein